MKDDRTDLTFKAAPKPLLLLTVALLAIFSLSAAAPVSARSSTAFAGAFLGHFTCTFSSSTSSCAVSLTGHLGRLGEFSASGAGPTGAGSCVRPFSGVVTFAARNGDSFTVSSTGTETCSRNPNVYTEAATFTITGGTGRFAGATGSGTWAGINFVKSNTCTSSGCTAFGTTIEIWKGSMSF